MENGQVKVVGIQKREKDGKVSYTIHGYQLFEDWENGEGFKAVSEWTKADLSKIKPGFVIVPIYGKGYQGKAVLSAVHIVSEK